MPKKPSLSQSMNRIGALIHSTLDLREIMERVIVEAAQAIGSETAALSLRQGEHWVVRYVHGFPPDVIGTQMDDGQEPHAVLAIRTKKPVIINDAFTDERVNREHMKKWGIRSVLVVPLVTEDEVIGVLFFNQHQPGMPFQESHADFAGQLASSLSLALRNARLFAQLQTELAQRGKAEQDQQEANEQLQLQAEELRVANEELQSQAEELHAQQEELRAQTEELRENAQALRESEERYRSLFENMLDGYAYCQMLFDDQGRPIDFVYLSVNDAFTRLTGLQHVVGKRVTEVIPTIRASHPELLETYGRVATTGRAERFEIEFEPLGVWLAISVYSSRPGYFTAVFDDITERKRAEEATARLAAIVESSDDAIISKDLEGIIRTWNAGAERLLGYRAEEMIGQPIAHLLPSERRDEEEEILRRLRRGEYVEHFETVRIAKDGRRVDVSATISPLRDTEGRLIGASKILRDITERKRTEKTLRESEERLKLAQQAAGAGVWDWDVANGKLNWSPELSGLFGLNPSTTEATFDVWRGVLHPEDRAVAEARIEQAVRNHTPLDSEYRIVRPTGEVRWIIALGSTTYDEHGAPRRMLGICTDITARKVAEQEWERARNTLAEAQKIAHLGSFEYVAATRTTVWSEEEYRIYGLDPAGPSPGYDVMLAKCIHPDDAAVLHEAFAKAMQSRSVYELEHRIVRPDGSVRWVYDRAHPYFDEKGDLLRYVGTTLDITERKAAEERLAQSRKTFAELIERAPFGIYVVDSQFRIAMMNTGSQEGAFRNVRPVIGRNFAEAMGILWPEPVAAEIIAVFRHTLETGEPYYSPRFTNPRHDVETVESYEWELHRMTLPDGQYGVICYYYDSTKLREAEAAVRESENRFRTMADAIPQLAWIARADGYIYWYNRRWYDYTGTTPEQMEGWGWQSVHDPRELPRVLERWKSSIATGEPFDMIFPLRGADGTFRPFLTRVMPLKDQQGRVRQWFGTNTDVSEQKRAEAALQEANEELQAQAEELQTQTEELRAQTEELANVNAALRESEERFRRYFDLGLIGMAITSPTKGWIEVNEECCRLLGYERDELVHKTWAQLTHPDDLAADVTQFDRVLTGQIDGYQIDKRFIRKDGRVVDVTLSVTGIRGADGAVDYFLALLQDVTERKRAEAALREWNATLESRVAERTADVEKERRRFYGVLETLPVYVCLLTPDHRIPFANRMFREWFGHSPDKKCYEFLFQRSQPCENCDTYTVLKTNTPHRWDWTGPNGRNYDIFDFPFLDTDGSPLILEMGIDITERKRAEAKLQELNVALAHRARQLQKLTLELSRVEDRERKRMAEILHDDLQQIIAGAKFHLTVLRNRIKHDVSLQAIGSHIDEMLREAVEKSRTLSHELSPAVLHHGDLTEALGWLASRIKSQHGLTVQVRGDGPVHLPSEAIGAFLYKAAQELLFNVVKHARVKEAQLRVRRHGPCICLSVSDRGRGFDPQGLRQTAGFGLLSIRERIELLGGRMKIKSAPGRGSTFFLVVPDEEGVVSSRTSVVGEEKGLADHRLPATDYRQPLRVLLADDHRIVREGLRSLLSEERDIEIVGEAVHGREAVDLALRLEPEVVIMDVAMPLIDGDEATRQIKTHLPRTRVIALSTYNEPETMQRMYRAGAEGYVLKTASAEELLAAIRGRSTGTS